MKVAKFLIPLCILLIFIAGCNNGQIESESQSIGNPTPEDFLGNEGADIFLLNDIVFSNAQDVEWVAELEYKLGEQVGEITKQADKASDFENGTANILPVGTKIYSTDTQAFIAVVNGEEIPYLRMIEG